MAFSKKQIALIKHTHTHRLAEPQTISRQSVWLNLLGVRGRGGNSSSKTEAPQFSCLMLKLEQRLTFFQCKLDRQLVPGNSPQKDRANDVGQLEQSVGNYVISQKKERKSDDNELAEEQNSATIFDILIGQVKGGSGNCGSGGSR